MFIKSITLLIGIFVFVADPNLAITAIWSTITTDLAPVFKGLLAISLLAMAMSTADSELNTCSVMVSHDIFGTLRTQKISPTIQLRLTRITSFIVGILADGFNILSKRFISFIVALYELFYPYSKRSYAFSHFWFS